MFTTLLGECSEHTWEFCKYSATILFARGTATAEVVIKLDIPKVFKSSLSYDMTVAEMKDCCHWPF